MRAARSPSPSERAIILRVRTLARAVAQAYYASREQLGLPVAQERRRCEFVAGAIETSR
jgi:glycyl-tRNA synthetase alpha subunit